jgi:uncharacterized membrane protein YbhN (UPF0104 family)
MIMIQAVTTLAHRRSVVTVLAVAALVVGLLAMWNQLPSPTAIAASLTSIDPVWVIVALVAQCLSVFAFAEIQRRLVVDLGGRLSRGGSVQLTLASGAISMAMPAGSAFGAGYTFRRLRHTGLTHADIAVSMIASAGLLSGTLVALYLLLTGPKLLDQLADVIGRDQVGSLVLLVGAVLLLAILRPRSFVRPAADDRRRHRHAPVTAALSAVSTVPAGTWSSSAGWAAVKWAADFGVLISATAAVGASVDVVAMATVYLGVQLLRQFPVTPGGIGVVEAALLAGLIAAGADPAPAAAAVLVYRLCTFWLMLPAGGAAALHARGATFGPDIATRSDPAALGGDPDGVSPGPRAGLADHRGQVIAHGALGKEQPVGDLGDGAAVRRRHQHFGLAGGERRFAEAQTLRGQRRIDHPKAGVHPADRIDEHLRRSILDHEPGGPRLHRPPQIPRAAEGGQHDHPAAG